MSILWVKQAMAHKNGNVTVAKNIFSWNTATVHGRQESKRK
jgi:hypothetical protein